MQSATGRRASGDRPRSTACAEQAGRRSCGRRETTHRRLHGKSQSAAQAGPQGAGAERALKGRTIPRRDSPAVVDHALKHSTRNSQRAGPSKSAAPHSNLHPRGPARLGAAQYTACRLTAHKNETKQNGQSGGLSTCTERSAGRRGLRTGSMRPSAASPAHAATPAGQAGTRHARTTSAAAGGADPTETLASLGGKLQRAARLPQAADTRTLWAKHQDLTFSHPPIYHPGRGLPGEIIPGEIVPGRGASRTKSSRAAQMSGPKDISFRAVGP